MAALGGDPDGKLLVGLGGVVADPGDRLDRELGGDVAELGGDQDGAMEDLDRDLDVKVETRESELHGEVGDQGGRLHGEDEHGDDTLGFGRKCEEILDRRWGQMQTLRGGLGYRLRDARNSARGRKAVKFERKFGWARSKKFGAWQEILLAGRCKI